MTFRTAQPHNSVGSITLQWPQKRLTVEPSRPLERQLESYPPQSTGLGKRGLLLHGDNFDGLSWLLANGYGGRVRLVYMDPPYNSNRTYTSRIRLRGKGQPALGETTAYDDVWQPADYLQFLTDRLLLLRELLHADGTLWLHCDHRMQAHLLLLLKEIFGADSHLNTVFWRSQTMRGANRLAIEALPLLPTSPGERRLHTTGFSERRGEGVHFTWPIWEMPLAVELVRSLLGLEDLQQPCPNRDSLLARGVVEVYRSQRITVDKYRNFTAAVPA